MPKEFKPATKSHYIRGKYSTLFVYKADDPKNELKIQTHIRDVFATRIRFNITWMER